MKKILISLLLSVMLIMQIPCAFAYEYIPYVGDSVISATPIAVNYEKVIIDGESSKTVSADGLADATQIVASCMVNPGSMFDKTVNVMLIVAGYNGKCLVSYNFSETVT